MRSWTTSCGMVLGLSAASLIVTGRAPADDTPHKMTDHDPMTLPQFTDAFLAEAVRFDGEVRDQRVAHARLQSAPAALATAPGHYGYRTIRNIQGRR